LQQLPGRDRELVLRPPGLDVLEHLHDRKHVRHTRERVGVDPEADLHTGRQIVAQLGHAVANAQLGHRRERDRRARIDCELQVCRRGVAEMGKVYVRPEEVAARKGIKLALGCSAAYVHRDRQLQPSRRVELLLCDAEFRTDRLAR